jgi:hypothetical protein
MCSACVCKYICSFILTTVLQRSFLQSPKSRQVPKFLTCCMRWEETGGEKGRRERGQPEETEREGVVYTYIRILVYAYIQPCVYTHTCINTETDALLYWIAAREEFQYSQRARTKENTCVCALACAHAHHSDTLMCVWVWSVVWHSVCVCVTDLFAICSWKTRNILVCVFGTPHPSVHTAHRD